MKYVIMLTVALAALAYFTQGAFAKRTAPPDVKSVVVDGIEYSAPAERMGCVIAVDTASGKEMWAIKIYTVIKNPDLEADVQDVFITNLSLNHGVLLIDNEHGDQYSLDLKTRKVTVIKGSDTIGR